MNPKTRVSKVGAAAIGGAVLVGLLALPLPASASTANGVTASAMSVRTTYLGMNVSGLDQYASDLRTLATTIRNQTGSARTEAIRRSNDTLDAVISMFGGTSVAALNTEKGHFNRYIANASYSSAAIKLTSIADRLTNIVVAYRNAERGNSIRFV